jgi:3-deoxy-D-manno-octulosonic-acid transferase
MQLGVKDDILSLKEKWGQDRTVVIAASTHDDEERQWLSHLNQLKQAIPNVMLLIVPRHPERFQRVYQLSMDEGFKTAMRSQPETINSTMDVLVVDSLGELLQFYSLSDYAFVGGSLVPVGGHNVLEPIAMRVPVLCGPYMNNSKAVCHALHEANAIVMANTIAELIDALVALHQNKQQHEQQVKQASAVLSANQGTIARYLERIDALLDI